MTRLIALVLIYLCPFTAQAGAWLEKKGHGFLSMTSVFRTGGDNVFQSESNAFASYGVTDWLTVGFDGFLRQQGQGHGLIFARLPLTRQSARLAAAAELGYGAVADRVYNVTKMRKIGLSGGVSFNGKGGGWLAVDAAAQDYGGDTPLVYKLDMTLGLPTRRRVRGLLQSETSTIDGALVTWSLQPGILIETKKNRRWLIAIEHREDTERRWGLKLALWRRF